MLKTTISTQILYIYELIQNPSYNLAFQRFCGKPVWCLNGTLLGMFCIVGNSLQLLSTSGSRSIINKTGSLLLYLVVSINYRWLKPIAAGQKRKPSISSRSTSTATILSALYFALAYGLLCNRDGIRIASLCWKLLVGRQFNCSNHILRSSNVRINQINFFIRNISS